MDFQFQLSCGDAEKLLQMQNFVELGLVIL
jgi:hypothetical protein